MIDLAEAQYVLLTTFRRDGTGVPTPVWVAPVDGSLGVWTAASSGKIKRIRHSGAVTVAECDRGGAPLGTAVPATATLLDAAGTRRVRRAVRRKYGLLGILLTTLIPLRSIGRGAAGEAGVSITLDAA